MIESCFEQRSERSDRIAAHLAEQVLACRVVNDPFQHFHITGALPDDVYAEMRRSMPSRDAYEPLNIKRWKNAAGVSTRDRLDLSHGDIERIPEHMRQVWIDLTSALLSRSVQQAVYGVLREDIALRMNCTVAEVLQQESFPSVLLVRDFEDYQLKPHPDGGSRVVTAMFYLADDNSPTDLGTSLYRENAWWQRLAGKRFEEFDRFPFLPNSLGVFVVNDTLNRTSWHGRELISGPSIVRDSIIVSYLSDNRPDYASKHKY